MDDSQHRRAGALLVACGVLWSTGGVLIKLISWHALGIWSARSLIAAAALYAIRRPSLRGLTRAEVEAAVALAATTGLFVLANKLTTAANAILIQYSAPVWVALLGQWFLGERASRLDWLTIALVLPGIGLFFFEQLTLDYALGNAVAFAAGIAFAFGAMTMRRAATQVTRDGRPIDPLRALLLGNILGAVIGLPFWFTGGPLPDAQGWAALAALGLVQQALAYVCYAAAIRHATAIEVMLIPAIEPVLAPVWVAIAYGEVPGPWALAGGAIVVGAVTLRAVLEPRSGESPV
ncbi:MAG: DMT family transporter [Deltaproteobacteria bacterium]|nr:DMT family transporter [Deltaproteobacteria bacterium]